MHSTQQVSTAAERFHDPIYREEISQKNLCVKYGLKIHEQNMKWRFSQLNIDMPLDIELQTEEIEDLVKVAYDCALIYYGYKPEYNECEVIKKKLSDLRDDVGFTVMARHESDRTNRNLFFNEVALKKTPPRSVDISTALKIV